MIRAVTLAVRMQLQYKNIRPFLKEKDTDSACFEEQCVTYIKKQKTTKQQNKTKTNTKQNLGRRHFRQVPFGCKNIISSIKVMDNEISKHIRT